MIKRFSSRRTKLNNTFLNERLDESRGYDRIAGYFSSSILEVAGEAIDSMDGVVRVICNSDLDIREVETAQLAQNAMRKEWCGFKPEDIGSSSKRFKKLYELLKNGKMQVKVIPNAKFGLIHGKAGIITIKDGTKTSFMGSANETYSGWKMNYEILWEDDSQESIDWVQEEFDELWEDVTAVNLSNFIIEDIGRISNRKVITSVDDWKENPDPASNAVESPVYRQEFGLWEHQKYFINLAFEEHKKPGGARFVLADTVGLGKTVQLAMSAQLMALYGDKPILVIAPKTLLWQWQEELKYLLDLPSAVWTGHEWIDEEGLKYPNIGEAGIKKCPRKVGLVSQGLVIANSKVLPYLLSMEYECVIVDEGHKARRTNFGEGKENHKPQPNKLMDFLLKISTKTKSMLIATATPVQLHPIEAWDLLNILSQGSDGVLGNRFSKWRTNPEKALKLITGVDKIDLIDSENWEWIRNPFPSKEENERTFGVIRRNLGMNDGDFVINPESYRQMRTPDKSRVDKIVEDNCYTENNPFIRHIVRRRRDYLENTTNPETGESYLKKIETILMGEKDEESIPITNYLQQAYEYAEKFCDLLSKRLDTNGGFLKTLLLRRVGSTMIAGEKTARKILRNWGGLFENDEDSNEEHQTNEIKSLSKEEADCLTIFIKTLNENKTKDPKYTKVLDLLVNEGWIDKGCIIFSQYFDSVHWVAKTLSVDLEGEVIGVYAGGDKSGIFTDGIYERRSKEEIKDMVKQRALRVLVGTDSASEGLNLQTLGSLINLDLPWNPTRLEQRKGRIQRIGQINDKVYIYNMRYSGSVEDRVHSLLSERLESIYSMFGQLPDILEDVWINVALNDKEKAKSIIGDIPEKHPFDIRYQD
ncbi:MAG TPA: phospholipase D-like domain-containing anti-phage protein, partial [Clostridium sp.]